MKAYVVVEGETDVVILRAVLPAELLEDVFVTPAGERSNITSIARTLLISRRKPVAELVDTASVDERIIHERRQTTQELLKAVAAGTPTKVILLIPSIEAIFFAPEDLLPRMIGKPLPEEVRLLMRGSPKEALERFFAQPGGPKNIKDLVDRLDDETMAALRAAQPIRELITFLAGVVKPQAKHTVM